MLSGDGVAKVSAELFGYNELTANITLPDDENDSPAIYLSKKKKKIHQQYLFQQSSQHLQLVVKIHAKKWQTTSSYNLYNKIEVI